MRKTLLILMAAMACTSVDSTEHCIETRYGAITKEKMGQGLNSTLTTEANCFSLTDQNFPANAEGKEPIEAQTRDPVTVIGDVSIVYAFDPATIVSVFNAKRSQVAVEVEIQNAIRSGYRSALAGWSVADIFSNRRAALDDSVRAHIQRKIGERAVIRTVFVRDVKVPPAIEQARIEAAAQQQALDKAQKQLAIDSMNARGQIITATATAEAKRLEAQSYATNPKLLDLEIARTLRDGMVELCPKVANTTCVIGGSIADTWRAKP